MIRVPSIIVVFYLLCLPLTWVQAGKSDQKLRTAKRLYEEAYIIKGINPESALDKLQQTLNLAPRGHVYYCKALRLKAHIEGRPKPHCEVKAKEVDYVEPDFMNEEAARLHWEGTELVKAEQYNRAISLFNHALQLEPGHCELLLKLGVLHTRIGERNDAIEYFQRFVQVCPKHRDVPKVVHLLKMMDGCSKGSF